MFNPFRGLAAQEPPPDSKATDSYFEKLLKYIPADIVAGYVAIAGILTEHNNQPLWLTWSVFGILLALTPLYVCYKKTEPPGFSWSKTFHWVTSCIAFTAWVFALGGPFAATFSWYQPYLGSVVLILTTLIIPVLEGQFINPSSPAAAQTASPTPPPATVAPQSPTQAPPAVIMQPRTPPVEKPPSSPIEGNEKENKQ